MVLLGRKRSYREEVTTPHRTLIGLEWSDFPGWSQGQIGSSNPTVSTGALQCGEICNSVSMILLVLTVQRTTISGNLIIASITCIGIWSIRYFCSTRILDKWTQTWTSHSLDILLYCTLLDMRERIEYPFFAMVHHQVLLFGPCSITEWLIRLEINQYYWNVNRTIPKHGLIIELVYQRGSYLVPLYQCIQLHDYACIFSWLWPTVDRDPPTVLTHQIFILTSFIELNKSSVGIESFLGVFVHFSDIHINLCLEMCIVR